MNGSAFTNGNQYALGTYNSSTNFSPQLQSGSNNLTNSGYAIKSESGGTVAITGGAQTAQQTIELTHPGGGSLNLLANPFTTYVAISSDAVTDSDAGGNVWTKNNSIVGYTDSQAAIYLWNGTDYSDIINGIQIHNYLAPGHIFVSFDSIIQKIVVK